MPPPGVGGHGAAAAAAAAAARAVAEDDACLDALARACAAYLPALRVLEVTGTRGEARVIKLPVGAGTA